MASPAFSASQYLARYPDLASAFGSTNYAAAAAHFAQYGRKAGRSGLMSLSTSATYQQVASAIVSPVTPSAADRVQSFTATDGRTVTVVVKVPANPAGPALVVPPLAAGADAYTYFKTWIQTATQRHASSLTFPAGNYSITPTGTAAHISFGTLADAIVDFGGSTLTFNGVTTGLQLTSNQRVIVRNATLDFSQVVAAPASVVSAGGTARALQVDAAYPIPSGAVARSVSLFDKTNKSWVQSPSFEAYPATAPTISGQTISSPSFSGFAVGATVLVRYHLYEGASVYVAGATTQDIAFENLTLYQSLGEGFNIYNAGRGFRISNCRIMVNPNDPSRLISLATDAAHFTSSAGDIILENNDFGSQGDDALNLAALLTPVVSSTTGTASQVSFSSNLQVLVGERIGVYNTGMGLLGTALVKTVSTSSGTTTVTLDNAIAGITTSAKVTNLDRVNSRYYIVNNQFHDNRARAMLLQAPNGWVQGNILTRQTLSSVNIMADTTTFSEGPGASNVRFTGNTILSPGTNHLGALGIYVSLKSGVAPESVEQQISIDANTFSQTPGPTIFVGSARNVSVLNNRITNANQVVDSPAVYYGSAFGSSSIVITKAQTVVVSGNTRDQNSTSGPISVDTNSTGNVTIQSSY